MPEELWADPRLQLPIYITTAHFYLDDMTEALGPTKIIPGSHRSGRANRKHETDWNGIKEQSFLGKAGDCIFSQRNWHRGAANTSDQIRHTFMVHYSHRMITQKFPPYPHGFRFDEELLAQASPRQRRLLGDHNKSNYD